MKNNWINMKEGDLITTNYKGYFRLIGTEGAYAVVKQEYDSNGKIKKSAVKRCGIMFCKLATERLKEELKEIAVKKQQLENILKNEKQLG